MTRALLDEPIPATCSIADVARFLGYSRATVERLLARHELPLVELERFGRLRRFTGRSVEAIVMARRRPGRA